MVSTIGAVILQDDSNSIEAVSGWFGMLRPPQLIGRANNALSSSLRAALPVRVGRKHWVIASSSGCKRSDMLGIVRIRYDHFPVKPCVYIGHWLPEDGTWQWWQDLQVLVPTGPPFPQHTGAQRIVYLRLPQDVVCPQL